MADAQPKKKPVWIACRATEGCPGNQAEIVFIQGSQSGDGKGGFTPAAGGRFVRYKCLTCNKAFHIAN